LAELNSDFVKSDELRERLFSRLLKPSESSEKWTAKEVKALGERLQKKANVEVEEDGLSLPPTKKKQKPASPPQAEKPAVEEKEEKKAAPAARVETELPEEVSEDEPEEEDGGEKHPYDAVLEARNKESIERMRREDADEEWTEEEMAQFAEDYPGVVLRPKEKTNVSLSAPTPPEVVAKKPAPVLLKPFQWKQGAPQEILKFGMQKAPKLASPVEDEEDEDSSEEEEEEEEKKEVPSTIPTKEQVEDAARGVFLSTEFYQTVDEEGGSRSIMEKHLQWVKDFVTDTSKALPKKGDESQWKLTLEGWDAVETQLEAQSCTYFCRACRGRTHTTENPIYLLHPTKPGEVSHLIHRECLRKIKGITKPKCPYCFSRIVITHDQR